MDRRLLDWARAVKAGRPGGPPPLWYFTDANRAPDPLRVARALPRGLCGVVFRHDGDPARAALSAALAQICRARGIALVVAGDARLATRLRAGMHLRDGRRRGVARWLRPKAALVTSSAHDGRAVRRAVRAGADLVFISPVFATESHSGAGGIGVIRWAGLAAAAGGRAAALGGIDGVCVRRLPRRMVCAAGAIGALDR